MFSFFLSSQRLSINEEYSSSDFAETIQMRARLLLRIHQAYLRQAKKQPGPGSAGVTSGGSTILQSKSKTKAVEDPNTILIAMNAKMSLSIARTVGKNCKFARFAL